VELGVGRYRKTGTFPAVAGLGCVVKGTPARIAILIVCRTVVREKDPPMRQRLDVQLIEFHEVERRHQMEPRTESERLLALSHRVENLVPFKYLRIKELYPFKAVGITEFIVLEKFVCQ
jgi:hypothetical protein